MVIRTEQMAKLSEDFYRRQHEAYVREARRQYPGATAGYDDAELRRIIERDQERALALKITEPRDVWRYIGLRYSPELQGDSKLIRAIVTRVLNNVDAAAKKRLDFIEQNAVTSLRDHRWSI
jgi:hypothetical protein